MNKMAQTAAFKAKIDSLSEEEKNALLQFLPESEIAKLHELPHFNLELINSMPLYAYLGKIHPSWFLEVFEPYSKKDRLMFISAFTQRREELANICGLDHHFVPLTNLAKNYIIGTLYSKLLSSNHTLPFAFLSHEPFFRLLTVPYDKLQLLIQLMGMHDVASEVKTLIRSDQIKAIYAAFHPKVIAFLKFLLTTKSQVSFGKLGLSAWDGDQKKLQDLVHKRGLNRIAKVVSDTSKSFQDHLMYLLSKEEALILKSFFSKKKNEDVLHSLIQQLNRALDYLHEEFKE